jgi:glyoxylase-like metal-dependent hydrolase (beta-lactamase superfamily II)
MLGIMDGFSLSERMNSLRINKMELGPIGTNAFLVWEEGGEEAILIDAPPDCRDQVGPVLEDQSLTLSEIWLTHGHWDHMAGAADLVTDSMTVIGHRADQTLFEQPAVMSTFAMPGMEFKPVGITKWVEDGDKLDLFGREVAVFHCPGHCPGNVIFYVETEGVCFVGDVIFAGSVGRADLPGGDFQALENSIREKVYVLPEATEICPGHGPNTNVGDERLGNPFVRPL